MLVRPGFEPTTSRTVVRHSTNWANRSAHSYDGESGCSGGRATRSVLAIFSRCLQGHSKRLFSKPQNMEKSCLVSSKWRNFSAVSKLGLCFGLLISVSWSDGIRVKRWSSVLLGLLYYPCPITSSCKIDSISIEIRRKITWMLSWVSFLLL